MKTRTIRLMMMFGVLIYIVLFHISYIYSISPNFSYWGYLYEPPAWGYIVVALGIALLPLSWMPIHLERPSQIIYWFLYLTVFIPTLFIPLYTTRSLPTSILGFGAVLLLCIGSMNLIYKIPLLRIPEPKVKISRFTFWSILALLTGSTYVYLIYLFGAQFELVSLLDVYDVRSGYKLSLQQEGPLAAYIVGMLAGAFNPFLIAYGIVNRRYVWGVLGVLGELYIYGITGFKTALLTPIAIVVLYFVLRRDGKFLGVRMVFGAAIGVLVCLVGDLLSQSILFSTLFVSRVVITPGLLTGFYFDFFNENPHLYLSHSIFSYFSVYPYNLNPPELIGYAYFQRLNVYANANIWADGFANFGYGGMLAFTILLSLTLWGLDSLSRGRPLRLVGLMLGMHAITLGNAALLTSILTHGIALTGLLIYLIPKSVVPVDLVEEA